LTVKWAFFISLVGHLALVFHFGPVVTQWVSGARERAEFSLVSFVEMSSPAPIASKVTTLARIQTAPRAAASAEGSKSEHPSKSQFLTLQEIISWGNEAPSYPALALRKGWEGTVTLRLFLTEGESVGKVDLVTSSGFDVLDDAAAETAKKWRVPPGAAAANGQLVRVEFKLLE
jgi:TonB family protein